MSLSDMMDLLEKQGFQRVFKTKLLENGEIVEGYNKDYNINYAIDEDKLFNFLQITQPKEYNKVSGKADFRSKFIKYSRSNSIIWIIKNF